ncbi:hypothetical protein GALL_458940 [mine drainage metagenome]|uniref:Uncharacterized protein n=1 Tax=mine drainage metagenome TaxID=410659 RepID=A0A1J5Q4T1_9ZZZZ
MPAFAGLRIDQPQLQDSGWPVGRVIRRPGVRRNPWSQSKCLVEVRELGGTYNAIGIDQAADGAQAILGDIHARCDAVSKIVGPGLEGAARGLRLIPAIEKVPRFQ